MARGNRSRNNVSPDRKYSRRDFVVSSGSALIGGAITASSQETARAATTAEKEEYPLSTGYLVYDSERCAGCLSCMLACSLVHDGASSASLSRIQVSRAVLTKYPFDIQISVCRQCPIPLCVKNCPTGACHVSAANGNVRMIDTEKCIGCQRCLTACPFAPHRTIWKPAEKKSTKCDLCVNTPYFGQKGGPTGRQACVTTCPTGAIKLVAQLPSQIDSGGYDIKLEPSSTSGPGLPPGGKSKIEAPLKNELNR